MIIKTKNINGTKIGSLTGYTKYFEVYYGSFLAFDCCLKFENCFLRINEVSCNFIWKWMGFSFGMFLKNLEAIKEKKNGFQRKTFNYKMSFSTKQKHSIIPKS